MQKIYTLILIILPVIGFSQCAENEYQITISTTSGEWAYEMSWELWDYNIWLESETPILSFQGSTDYEEVSVQGCVSDTNCFIIIANDTYGDGWNGGSITMNINNNEEWETYELTNGITEYWYFELNTDPCTWEIPGCTDAQAINYNEFANTDDGSCMVPFLFDWDKQEREYFLYSPEDLPENSPLLFMLHGYFGSGHYWLEVFKELADEYKFMVCAPNGLPDNFKINHWNANFNSLMTTVDDLGFLSNLAFYLQDEYSLNPNKTFACGMSNGGYMSWSLAKHAPEVFKAIASVTGTMSNLDWNDEFNTSPLIPVMQISGTNDDVVPMDGSMVDDGEGWAGAPSIQSIMEFWSEEHGCSNTTTETVEFVDYLTDITYYNTCQNHAELRLYLANQMGHTWPEFAASEIWDFFMQVENPSWNCINGACIEMVDGTGEYDNISDCESTCFISSIIEPNKGKKKLKKITDILGQETPVSKNTTMFYIYDDGTVEKRIIIQ